MYKTFSIALFFILAGCDLSDRSVKDLAISSVIEQLKDPDSAKFSDVTMTMSDDRGTFNVCGLVNTKNSFGAYSGDTRFVVSGYKNKQNNEYAIYSSKLDDSHPSTNDNGPKTIFERMYWDVACRKISE